MLFGLIICVCLVCLCCIVFFFKQKTAYELRISDWSSDVCSSDLDAGGLQDGQRKSEVAGVLRDLGLPGLALLLEGLQTRDDHHEELQDDARSEERRVGKECGSTGRSPWSPSH